MGRALARLVAFVQAARKSAVVAGHPQVGAPGVEDHVERLGGSADLHLSDVGWCFVLEHVAEITHGSGEHRKGKPDRLERAENMPLCNPPF